MKLFVDVDNTLLRALPFNCTLDEWRKMFFTKFTQLNLNLLRWLKARKAEGHTIIMWTDRDADMQQHTLKNFGKWGYLFDEFSFNGDGICGKIKNSVDGFVIDDKERYIKCGLKGGMIINWKLRRSC